MTTCSVRTISTHAKHHHLHPSLKFMGSGTGSHSGSGSGSDTPPAPPPVKTEPQDEDYKRAQSKLPPKVYSPPIGLLNHRNLVQDEKLVVATLASLNSGDPSNIIKQDLRLIIQSRRKAEGKGELQVDFKTPPRDEEQLTSEELEKRARRRELNRLAAKRSREKGQRRKETLIQEIQGLHSHNGVLEGALGSLVQERDNLVQALKGHLPKCQDSEAMTRSAQLLAFSNRLAMLLDWTIPGPGSGPLPQPSSNQTSASETLSCSSTKPEAGTSHPARETPCEESSSTSAPVSHGVAAPPAVSSPGPQSASELPSSVPSGSRAYGFSQAETGSKELEISVSAAATLRDEIERQHHRHPFHVSAPVSPCPSSHSASQPPTFSPQSSSPPSIYPSSLPITPTQMFPSPSRSLPPPFPSPSHSLPPFLPSPSQSLSSLLPSPSHSLPPFMPSPAHMPSPLQSSHLPSPLTHLPSPHTHLPSPHSLLPSAGTLLPSPQPHLPSPQPHLSSPHSHLPSPQTHLPSPHSHLPSPQPHLPSPHSHLPLQPHIQSPQTHLPSPHTHLPSPQTHLPSPQTHLPSPHSHLPSPQPHLPSPQTYLPSPHSHLPSPQTRLPSPQPPLPSPQTPLPSPHSHFPSPHPYLPSPHTNLPSPQSHLPSPHSHLPSPSQSLPPRVSSPSQPFSSHPHPFPSPSKPFPSPSQSFPSPSQPFSSPRVSQAVSRPSHLALNTGGSGDPGSQWVSYTGTSKDECKSPLSNPALQRTPKSSPSTVKRPQSLDLRGAGIIPKKDPALRSPVIPKKDPALRSPVIPKKDPALRSPTIPKKDPALRSPIIETSPPPQVTTSSLSLRVGGVFKRGPVQRVASFHGVLAQSPNEQMMPLNLCKRRKSEDYGSMVTDQGSSPGQQTNVESISALSSPGAAFWAKQDDQAERPLNLVWRGQPSATITSDQGCSIQDVQHENYSPFKQGEHALNEEKDMPSASGPQSYMRYNSHGGSN